ncbi:MAG: 50S ribosomal protein L4 [Alphaproteobacteria bacterium]|nr:50S ribosomal protein L4 [Alphaproteobacteria bacterium]MCY4319210.1 50S ribosomal protein L4 [Alphaproteobacteria bacterium]
MQLPVRNWDNHETGSIELADGVFGGTVRRDLLARVVNWQRARKRGGTRKTKERSEIARSKSKIYRQKGTGRARHGAATANVFRGGGVVHGPRVRDHAHKLPKKVRAAGLRAALASKTESGKLIVVEDLALESGRTRDLAQRLRGMSLDSALILGGETVDENFRQAAANIIGIDVLPRMGANVYDILRRDVLVLTRDAAAHLEERLS